MSFNIFQKCAMKPEFWILYYFQYLLSGVKHIGLRNWNILWTEADSIIIVFVAEKHSTNVFVSFSAWVDFKWTAETRGKPHAGKINRWLNVGKQNASSGNRQREYSPNYRWMAIPLIITI